MRIPSLKNLLHHPKKLTLSTPTLSVVLSLSLLIGLSLFLLDKNADEQDEQVALHQASTQEIPPTEDLFSPLERARQDLILLPNSELHEAKTPLPLKTTGALQDGTTAIHFLNRALQLLHSKNPDQFPLPSPEEFLEKNPARLVNLTFQDLGSLRLLAQGKSNFATSPESRVFNVHKAANEKFKAILIPDQSTFSFVDLVGPIDGENGWKKALNIFRGTELEYAPGGGVCQMSTTIYRAALNAGLPIIEQRNHSLYVDYYEEYGSGLDATIFPGVQDFKFMNDTGAPLVLISFIEGEDLLVNLYGTPDGREAKLVGPFTASNENTEVYKEFGDLGIGQIVWKYTLTPSKNSPDPTPKVEWLLSDYMSKVKQHRESIEP